MSKPPPPDPHWPMRLVWWAWGFAAWPWTVHQLKQSGMFRKTGWMTWESIPPEREPAEGSLVPDAMLTSVWDDVRDSGIRDWDRPGDGDDSAC